MSFRKHQQLQVLFGLSWHGTERETYNATDVQLSDSHFDSKPLLEETDKDLNELDQFQDQSRWAKRCKYLFSYSPC